MTRANRLAAGLLALALASGCSSSSPKPSADNPAPVVPVAGADVSALVGKWQGDYAGKETGRTGSIIFEFKSGGKIARGDVLMVPKGAYSATPSADVLKTMPQVLQIAFVNAEGGEVRGTMDPYTDPSCNCPVQTTFVGKVAGDTIEGTFSTSPEGKPPISTGTWKMTRVKEK